MSAAPTWMIDGKPGEILRLMGLAQSEVSPVRTETKGTGKEQMTFKGAEEIKRAARAVLTKHGIVVVWETSEQQCVTKALGEMRVSARFIAPDGSSISHSVIAAAYAGMGRHFTVTLTAGVKQILALALQLVVEGDDDDPAPAEDIPQEQWSDNLRLVVAAIDACQTHEELDASSKIDAWALLTPEERGTALVQGNARHNWLVRSKHAGSGRRG